MPVYDEVEDIAQIQPIKSSEIQFINNYNSSSTYKNVYFNRNHSGLNRRRLKGSDVIIWQGYQWNVDSAEFYLKMAKI